jgi:hypothetical protein
MEPKSEIEAEFYRLLGEGICMICNRKLKDHEDGLTCAEVDGRRLIVNAKGKPHGTAER